MNSKWYWLIRQKYRNLKFQIKKAAFRLNERKESSERLKPNNRYYNNHSVEHLFNCIFAELKLESKRVTPDWYIKQAVAYTVYQDLNDVVDAMDKIYNNVFSVGKRLTENKCYLQGATVLFRLYATETE